MPGDLAETGSGVSEVGKFCAGVPVEAFPTGAVA